MKICSCSSPAWRGDQRRLKTSEMDSKGRGVVSWVVSARTTAPHLPLLRGGEVLLIPPRVTAVVGGELPALLREARLRDVAAVVFEQGEPSIGSLESVG